jgi:hypothetical protein
MKIKHIMQEYMVYSDRTSISALHKLFLSRTYNHQDQGKLGLLAKLKYHLIVTKDKDAVACETINAHLSMILHRKEQMAAGQSIQGTNLQNSPLEIICGTGDGNFSFLCTFLQLSAFKQHYNSEYY